MGRGLEAPGFILVRYAQDNVRAVLERLLAVLEEQAEALHQMYVVVAPDRVRVRELGPERSGR